MDNKPLKESDIQIQKDTVLDIVFSSTNVEKYIYKKTVAIGQACYMLSDLLDKGESLKMTLRKISHTLLDIFMSYKSGYIPENLTIALMILREQVILGMSSGLVSEMNGNILIREILVLIDEINLFNNKNIGGHNLPVITDDFFNRFNYLKTEDGDQSYKGHKGQGVFYNNLYTKNTFGESHISKSVKSSDIKNNDNGNSRSAEILSVIKSKGQVTIKDISAVISGCSEKTIQRQLVTLLNQGKIRREGDRRWSKYSLK